MTGLWLGLSLAIVLQAVLVAVARRRVLPLLMLAWVASPLLVAVGLDAWEAVFRPGRYPPSTAFYGFMLVSPILALPWLMACLLGFGLGFGLRLLLRPFRRGRRSPLPTPPAPPPVRAAVAKPVTHPLGAPPTETPGWRSIHIGLEQDGLTIGGLEVWKEQWRKAGEPSIQLPHPTYPKQIHKYEVFTIGDTAKPVQFAACELSNGVWGFSVRQDDPVEAQGASQDGTLRYEHRLGEAVSGRPDPACPAAILIDAASGQVLVDCTAWAFSRIVPNADGSMSLRLRQGYIDVLFRIDPPTCQFWNHGESGPRHPLASLAVAVEQARHDIEKGKGPVSYRIIAPDGSIRVDLASVEFANTHWVNSPRVVDLTRGRVVLDLRGTDWDAEVSFPRSHCASFGLRRYRSGGSLALDIDLARNTYQIVSLPGWGGASAAAPLAEVASALEAATAPIADAHIAARSATAPAHPWAAWRTALLIAVAALVAMAGATILVLRVERLGGQASPPLARVPQFDTPRSR